MLKRSTLIILVCCVIALAVGVGGVVYLKRARLAVEKILPQGPLLYIQVSNAEKDFKEITATQLWKTISGIDYQRLIERSNLDANQKALWTLFTTQAFNPVTGTLLKKFFGQDVALAVYPMEIQLANIIDISQLSAAALTQMIDEVFSNIFFVTRLGADLQLTEFLSQSLTASGSPFSTETMPYEGYVIHTIHIPITGSDASAKLEVGLSFARIKDLFVIGLGEKTIRRSIDVFRGIESSLAEAPDYQQVKHHFVDGAGLKVFVSMEEFFTIFKKQAKSLGGAVQDQGDGRQKQIEAVLAKVGGVKNMGLSFKWAKPVRLKFNLFFDPSQLHAELSALYACLPQENTTIAFIPREALAYQWNTCFEPKSLWAQLKSDIEKNIPHQAEAAGPLKEFEQAFGFKIEEEVLPIFGHEIGGYLADIQAGGLFPIPQLLFFIRIEDQAKAEDLLNKVLDQPFLPLKQQNHAGIAITSVVLPLGEQLQPSYCFLDHYLLVAVHGQLLKDSINTYQDQSLSLRSSEDFRAVDFGLTGKNRDVQFIKVDRLLKKIEGVIEWANAWAVNQEKQKEAFQSGSEQRLVDIKNDIAQKEQQWTALKERLNLLEGEIWDLKARGLEHSAKQTELEGAKKEVDHLEKDITAAREQQQEYEEIIRGYEKNLPDPALRRFYLDELVYPLLRGLSAINALGGRTTLEKGMFESDVFIQIEK